MTNMHINKYKTLIKSKQDENFEITPELVDKIKKIEKEPVIIVKDLRKHFED